MKQMNEAATRAQELEATITTNANAIATAIIINAAALLAWLAC